MAESLTQWMPRERWDALVRGEGCSFCEAYPLAERVNQYGYTIADLRISRFRLVANQYVPGYSVLICAKHVREPYDLSPADQALFFDDLMQAAQALDRVLNPVKMNFQILGNAIPHLHAHLMPRYYGDAAPGTPIDPTVQDIRLSPAEYEERVRRIVAAL